jgi:hypothetical protein
MERSRSGDIRTDSESITQRHKGTKKHKKAAIKYPLMAAFLCFFVPFVSLCY